MKKYMVNGYVNYFGEKILMGTYEIGATSIEEAEDKLAFSLENNTYFDSEAK